MYFYIFGSLFVATVVFKKLWSKRKRKGIKDETTQTQLLMVSDKEVQTDNGEQIIPQFFDPRNIMYDSPESNKSARRYRQSLSSSSSPLQFEFS